MILKYFKITTYDDFRYQYKILVKKYHPDINPNINQKFIKEVNIEKDYIEDKKLLYFAKSKENTQYRDFRDGKNEFPMISFKTMLVDFTIIAKKSFHKPSSVYFKLKDVAKDCNYFFSMDHFEIIEIFLDYKKGWKNHAFEAYKKELLK